MSNPQELTVNKPKKCVGIKLEFDDNTIQSLDGEEAQEWLKQVNDVVILTQLRIGDDGKETWGKFKWKISNKRKSNKSKQ